MMTRAEKDVVVAGIKANIEKAQAVFLTNLVGIPSVDSVRIRKQVREAKGHMVITRNTLFARAAKGTHVEGLLADLKGSTAVSFAFEDAPAVAKIINDAAGEFDGIVTVKGGMSDRKALSKAEFISLTKPPSRAEMLGTLLATFYALVFGFSRVLKAIREEQDPAS